MVNTPRMHSLVKFKGPSEPCTSWADYPFTPDTVFVYLGEIPGMSEHCIVIEKDSSEVHVGYDCEDFRELTEEEL